MKVFYHSGMLGDIIYSLPTVMAILEKDRENKCIFVTGLPEPMHLTIAPLLDSQPYIKEVRHISTSILPIGYINLDSFVKSAHNTRQHIVNAHLESQHLPYSDFNHWLYLPYIPSKVLLFNHSFAIINRTLRHQDKLFNWKKEISFLKKRVERLYFIGLHLEYENFIKKFDCEKIVGHLQINDYLDAAYLIQEAEYFSGNQSSLLAIRQGLGLPYRMEQSPHHVDCNQYTQRETIINPVTRKIHLLYSTAKKICGR